MSEDREYPPFPELPQLVASVLKYLTADNDIEGEADLDLYTERDNIAMAAQHLVRRVNAMEERQRPYWWKADDVETLQGELARRTAEVAMLRANLDRQHKFMDICFRHTQQHPLSEELKAELGILLGPGGPAPHPLYTLEAIEELGKALAAFTVEGGWVARTSLTETLIRFMGTRLGIDEELSAAYSKARGA